MGIPFPLTNIPQARIVQSLILPPFESSYPPINEQAGEKQSRNNPFTTTLELKPELLEYTIDKRKRVSKW